MADLRLSFGPGSAPSLPAWRGAFAWRPGRRWKCRHAPRWRLSLRSAWPCPARQKLCRTCRESCPCSCGRAFRLSVFHQNGLTERDNRGHCMGAVMGGLKFLLRLLGAVKVTLAAGFLLGFVAVHLIFSLAFASLPRRTFPRRREGAFAHRCCPPPTPGKGHLSDSEAYRTAFHAAASGSPRRL